MTFLPIVERELRVASRRRGTYWLRSGVALAVVGLGTWLYLMGRHQRPAELGMMMFIGLTIVAGLFCLTAGARATADCLSEEKRDGTLGLLFLTDLRGYDVVIGKLVASSLNTFYGLIATLPVLAIPLLMGGVTAAEFWRVTLVLLNTLLFSLAAGLLASSLTKSARHAASLCFVTVIALAGLLPLGAAILDGVYHLRQASEWLLIPSTGYAFAMAFDMNYRGHEEEFLVSLAITHGLTWIFLIAACLIVPRSWQDRAATVTELRWRDRWLRWSLGDSAERAAFRARLLDVNPFYWLSSRSRIKPALVWALLGALVCGWTWCWFKYGSDWTNPANYIITALLLNTVLKVWFAGEACAQLAEDRRIGALELLLSTPLGVAEVLRGQALALGRQFLWPVLVVAGLELAFMSAGLASHVIRNDEGIWVLVWVAGLVMFIADLAALFYVCLWQALTARNASRASSAALVRILALPWILYAVLMMFIGLSSNGRGMEGGGFIMLWLFLGLIVNAFFGLRAKTNLETRFRDVATTRYTPPPSLWKRLFGPQTTSHDS
jgi:hypothetical protein